MDKRGDDDLSLARIPVFVFPSSVVFNASDRDHLKQILTIYNPYDFPVRFKVLSTSPSNYTVIDPEGSINSKNSVDLIVKLTSHVPTTNESTTHFQDKFRVQIYNYSTRAPLGRKDVQSIIHFGNPMGSNLMGSFPSGSSLNSMDMSPSESFQQCPSSIAAAASGKSYPSSSSTSGFYNSEGVGGSVGGGNQHYNPNYVAVLTAVACIALLMLPTNTTSEKETSINESTIPHYLHLTVNQKLLIAYTLGLCTMVLFAKN